ncbi:hypothetical protein [Nocardioides sp. AX2bis]|uniref:hypothetical protein n=1 Tax=Nocardioides sp. AX2bis TaxID=2653157 RepID=UPI0012F191BE|nr:hypothetical protein [Nocardioides sp. AX2bis]VXC44008.1 conserved hypothetical protein [Nocardioides sp. AX2bis]
MTTYLYDEATGRVASTVTSSPWTDEDRALLLALASYEESLCACGEPRALAHHPDNDGWYHVETEAEHGAAVCHACGAIEHWRSETKAGDVPAGLIPVLVHDRDYEAKPLPPGR